MNEENTTTYDGNPYGATEDVRLGICQEESDHSTYMEIIERCHKIITNISTKTKIMQIPDNKESTVSGMSEKTSLLLTGLTELQNHLEEVYGSIIQ